MLMVNFPVSPEKTCDYFHTLLHATMRSHRCKHSLFTAFFLYLMCSLGFHDGDDDGQLVVCFFLSFIALFLPTNSYVVVFSFPPPLQRWHNDVRWQRRWVTWCVSYISFIALVFLPDYSVIVFSFLSALQWRCDNMGRQTTYGNFFNIICYYFFTD